MIAAATNASAGPRMHAGPGGDVITRFIHFTLLGVLFGLACKYLSDRLDADTGNKILLIFVVSTVLLPTLYWFTTTTVTRIASAVFAVGVTVGFAFLYLLAEQTFGWEFKDSGKILVWGWSVGIFTLIAIPFFRTVVERRRSPFHYRSLFEFAWNTVVVYVLAWIFTGVFWLVLWLWSELFMILEIRFFRDLFTEGWFPIPATFGAFAAAVGILRQREEIILRVRSLLFVLLHVLAPILAVATGLFAIALAFVGLEPARRLGSPDQVMMFVTFTALVLINAVLGDGEEDAAGGATRRFVRLTARVQGILLPVFVGLAAYIIWRRIGANGLEVWDIYEYIILGILALHAVVYAVAGILPAWSAIVQQANIWIAGVAALVAVAVLTPLINAERLSAEHAYERLKAGKVSAADFHYGQLHFRLGRAGRDVLDRIEQDETLPGRETIESELAEVRSADDYYKWYYAWNQRRQGEPALTLNEVIDQYIKSFPEGAEIAPGWREAVKPDESGIRQCANEERIHKCYLYATDLNGDGQADYAFFRLYTTTSSPTPSGREYGTLTTALYLQTESGAFVVYGDETMSVYGQFDEFDLAAAYKELEAGTVRFDFLPVRMPRFGGQFIAVNGNTGPSLAGQLGRDPD